MARDPIKHMAEIRAEEFRQALVLHRDIEQRGVDLLALAILLGRLAIQPQATLAEHLENLNGLTFTILETSIAGWLDRQ